MRATFALALALIATAPQEFGAARAEFNEVPYTRFAVTLFDQLEQIAVETGLNAEFTHAAIHTAAYWTYTGPCRGDARKVEKADISHILNPDPSIPYHAATLQMVAILGTSNLGREPTENMCRFAKDIAGER